MATNNLRKAKLEKIMTKIVTFMFQETFTDEEEAQKMLTEAVKKLEKAADLLVKSDEAHQGEGKPE